MLPVSTVAVSTRVTARRFYRRPQPTSSTNVRPRKEYPSTMKTEQIRQHFQVQVPNYSGLMQRLIPFYDTQRDVMLGLMPLDRDAPLRVLDLGCGPGL